MVRMVHCAYLRPYWFKRQWRANDSCLPNLLSNKINSPDPDKKYRDDGATGQSRSILIFRYKGQCSDMRKNSIYTLKHSIYNSDRQKDS